MAKYHEVQRDFSGGEVSGRMFMRDDLQLHTKSLLVMENMMPTLQGTALRTPGSRFLWEFLDTEDATTTHGRIIPYITPNNNYSLLEIVPKKSRCTS